MPLRKCRKSCRAVYRWGDGRCIVMSLNPGSLASPRARVTGWSRRSPGRRHDRPGGVAAPRVGRGARAGPHLRRGGDRLDWHGDGAERGGCLGRLRRHGDALLRCLAVLLAPRRGALAGWGAAVVGALLGDKGCPASCPTRTQGVRSQYCSVKCLYPQPVEAGSAPAGPRSTLSEQYWVRS